MEIDLFDICRILEKEKKNVFLKYDLSVGKVMVLFLIISTPKIISKKDSEQYQTIRT